MLAQIEKNLGGHDVDDTFLLECLNFAMIDVAAARNWRSMKDVDSTLSTAADVFSASLPSRTKDVLALTYKDGVLSRKLTYISPEEYKRRYPHPEQDASSEPVFWTRQEEKFFVYPPPSLSSKVYEFYVTRWPQELSSGGGSAQFPLSRLEPLAIAKASAYVSRAFADYEREQAFERQSALLMKRYVRQDQDPSDFKPRWGYNRDHTYWDRWRVTLAGEGNSP
jgi:hypothetical protein